MSEKSFRSAQTRTMKKDEEERAVLATIGDFSQQAIGKAVLRHTIQHPLTLYPMVLGVLGATAAVVLDFPFAVLLGSITALGGGVMGWVVNFFFRSEVFATRYIHGCQEAVALQRGRLMDTMYEDLGQCRSIAGSEHFAEQGIAQLEQVQKRLVTLRELLADKLNRSELSYGRYLGAAERVYLAVLDNLRDVTTILKSVSTIDPAYLSHRLNELKQLKNPTDADREENETLVKRRALREQQLQRVNVLLTRNEEAMTQMDDATAALANLDTDESRPSLDLETAIEELQKLARASQRFK